MNSTVGSAEMAIWRGGRLRGYVRGMFRSLGAWCPEVRVLLLDANLGGGS